MGTDRRAHAGVAGPVIGCRRKGRVADGIPPRSAGTGAPPARSDERGSEQRRRHLDLLQLLELGLQLLYLLLLLLLQLLPLALLLLLQLLPLPLLELLEGELLALLDLLGLLLELEQLLQLLLLELLALLLLLELQLQLLLLVQS